MSRRIYAFFAVAATLGVLCLAPVNNPPTGGVAVEVDPVYVAAKDTDGTLAANSDAKVATQKAVKTYSDTKQTAAQVQALIDANHGGGYATTETAEDTTTLTAESAYAQFVTGTIDHEFQLPVTSTLREGFQFLFVNNATHSITVRSSGGGQVAALLPGDAFLFTCKLTSGTSPASWDAKQISGFAPLLSPAFQGTPTAPTQIGSDNSTKLATTQFVKAVDSVKGQATFDAAGGSLINGRISGIVSSIARESKGAYAITFSSLSDYTVSFACDPIFPPAFKIIEKTSTSLKVTVTNLSGVETDVDKMNITLFSRPDWNNNP